MVVWSTARKVANKTVDANIPVVFIEMRHTATARAHSSPATNNFSCPSADRRGAKRLSDPRMRRVLVRERHTDTGFRPTHRDHGGAKGRVAWSRRELCVNGVNECTCTRTHSINGAPPPTHATDSGDYVRAPFGASDRAAREVFTAKNNSLSRDFGV